MFYTPDPLPRKSEPSIEACKGLLGLVLLLGRRKHAAAPVVVRSLHCKAHNHRCIHPKKHTPPPLCVEEQVERLHLAGVWGMHKAAHCTCKASKRQILARDWGLLMH